MKIRDTRGRAAPVAWTWREAGPAPWAFAAIVIMLGLSALLNWRTMERTQRAHAQIAAALAAGGVTPPPPPNDRRWWYWTLAPNAFFLALGAFVCLRGAAVYTVARRRGRGQCGHCAYDLRDITPEPDGCRLCPECNAAWADGPWSPKPRR